MTEAVYRGLRITESTEMNIDGESHDLKKGDVVTVDEKLGRSMVNKMHVAEYTGKQYGVNMSEVDGRIIKSGDYVTHADSNEEKSSENDDFDFEAYVDDHNADTVIEDVEGSDSVAWLENLANHDDRKTVQEAIEDRLKELE